jgi:alkanesulfonate monooxygenase SsuD/methylene tetrahydromethanopterin reductase-like flavin-dependent oxidoreductase (luciferase family)
VLGAPWFVGAGWQDAAVRYSVNVPNFGEFAAPEVFAEVARRAEEAGWDALLVWDHVVGEKDLRWEIADPWVLLTAAALATSRIRLGTAITPVARRRPSKLAREVATLDRLTGGRMVLGAALGAPVADEYASFGDTTDTRVLAERLDEGLHALDLLWSGEPVTYRGKHVTVDDVVFLPTPVQRPRVPVWVGGFWPNKAPMRRAARWDGAIPAMAGFEAARTPAVSEVFELVRFLRGCRAENGLANRPFDIVIGGMSPAGTAGRDLVGPLADLGITWWDERMPWGDDLERAGPILRRIGQGPPRV